MQGRFFNVEGIPTPPGLGEGGTGVGGGGGASVAAQGGGGARTQKKGNKSRGRSGAKGGGTTAGLFGSSASSGGCSETGALAGSEGGGSSGSPATSELGTKLKIREKEQDFKDFEEPKEKEDSAGAPKLRRNKWINRQVTRVANSGNLPRLLQTIQYHISEMNAINLVTALHRVTKLAVNSPEPSAVEKLLRHPSFKQLNSTVVQRIEAGLKPGGEGQGQPFEVQCMSIVCWSCATLRLQEDRLMSAIADIALERLGELKPFELSNMVWAYAKLSMGTPQLFQGVSKRMLSREFGEFSLQCLSMVAWSFATARHRDPFLFSNLAAEIVNCARGAKPQEIANTLWAYAKSRCAEADLFQALGDAALANNLLWSFKPQELSNTLWAFATVGLQHPPLFRRGVAVAIGKRREMSPQNSANILWAYAKLQVCRRSGLFPALFMLLSGSTAGGGLKHKPQEISAILWAAAREGCLNGTKLDDIQPGQLLAGGALSAQGLQDLPPEALEAFAEVGLDTPGFFDLLSRENSASTSTGRLEHLEPIGLVNLFRGMALLVRRSPAAADAAAAGAPTAPEMPRRQLQALGAIGWQLLTCADELREAELEHVAQSLDLLAPSPAAAAWGPLPSLALATAERRARAATAGGGAGGAGVRVPRGQRGAGGAARQQVGGGNGDGVAGAAGMWPQIGPAPLPAVPDGSPFVPSASKRVGASAASAPATAFDELGAVAALQAWSAQEATAAEQADIAALAAAAAAQAAHPAAMLGSWAASLSPLPPTPMEVAAAAAAAAALLPPSMAATAPGLTMPPSAATAPLSGSLCDEGTEVIEEDGEELSDESTCMRVVSDVLGPDVEPGLPDLATAPAAAFLVGADGASAPAVVADGCGDAAAAAAAAAAVAAAATLGPHTGVGAGADAAVGDWDAQGLGFFSPYAGTQCAPWLNPWSVAGMDPWGAMSAPQYALRPPTWDPAMALAAAAALPHGAWPPSVASAVASATAAAAVAAAAAASVGPMAPPVATSAVQVAESTGAAAAAPWLWDLEGAGEGWSASASPVLADAPADKAMWEPRSLDASCLLQSAPFETATGEMSGVTMGWRCVNLEDHMDVSVIGVGSSVVRLRYGVFDERVVVKRSTCHGSLRWPIDVATCPHILVPCARISASAASPMDCYLAYRYCGESLPGLLSRRALSSEQTAAVGLGVLRAAKVLLDNGLDLDTLSAKEIFLDDEGEAHVRLRYFKAAGGAGSRASQGVNAKWLSPEEAAGVPVGWASVAFRVGLLLYCIGMRTADPYPHKRGDLVLLDLRREVAGAGAPVRPDLTQYSGDPAVAELIARCLETRAAERPNEGVLEKKLQLLRSKAIGF